MELVRPWRITAGFVPLLYGTLVILELERSWMWLLVACGLIVIAVMVASRLGFSLLALWPAFAGIFCLVACLAALAQSLPNYGLVPLSASNTELWVAAALAGGFIGWGLRSAQKVAEFF
jgi:hypothetical protein